jgi:hypothetical protein
MNDIFKLLTLFTLTLQSIDIIKQELTPFNPPEINEPKVDGILIDTTGAIEVNKPIFDETLPSVKEDNGISRVVRIPPEVDSQAVDYKGNLSVTVQDLDGKPLQNARIDIFVITAKIRRPRLVGDNTPIPPYPDVVAKRAETYYTGADGRLECDVVDGSYMLGVLKGDLGGRSDAFSVKNDTKEFTIKTVRF